MCRKKRKVSPFVVKERSEDIIPFSIPIISVGSSNLDNPLDSFVSPTTGRDVKDEPVIVRSRTTSQNLYKNINKSDNENSIKGFKVIQSKKEQPTNPERSVLDILEINGKKEETPIIQEEVVEYKTASDDMYFHEEVKAEVKEDTPILDQKIEEISVSSLNDNDKISIEDIQTIGYMHKVKEFKGYVAPPISLLNDPVRSDYNYDEWIKSKIEIIDRVLSDFKVGGHVEEFTVGPTFTRFAVRLDPGVSGSKVDSLNLDLQRELEVNLVRVENPIKGRPLIGIEVPNEKRNYVTIKEVFAKDEFRNRFKPLLVPTGLDVDGKVKFVSIDNPAHGIIAGQSGSGKSIFINALMLSLIYQYGPDELKFLCVDPKQVDIAPYEGIPHMMAPIVATAQDGVKIIKYCNEEMERRYSLFKKCGCQKIEEYEEYRKIKPEYPKMPYIVMIIDEAGSVLETGGKEIEQVMFLLTSKARAAGIHIFLSMQKPISRTLPTTIKSNLGLRFAFSVMNFSDSQLILEKGGAEKLLGKGDMLFSDGAETSRYQAPFAEQNEVKRVVQYLLQFGSDYWFDPFKKSEEEKRHEAGSVNDELFADACRYVVNKGQCSANTLTTQFGIGWNRASDLVRAMTELGIIEEFKGKAARDVLVSFDTLEEILSKYEN